MFSLITAASVHVGIYKSAAIISGRRWCFIRLFGLKSFGINCTVSSVNIDIETGGLSFFFSTIHN